MTSHSYVFMYKTLIALYTVICIITVQINSIKIDHTEDTQLTLNHTAQVDSLMSEKKKKVVGHTKLQ